MIQSTIEVVQELQGVGNSQQLGSTIQAFFSNLGRVSNGQAISTGTKGLRPLVYIEFRDDQPGNNNPWAPIPDAICKAFHLPKFAPITASNADDTNSHDPTVDDSLSKFGLRFKSINYRYLTECVPVFEDRISVNIERRSSIFPLLETHPNLLQHYTVIPAILLKIDQGTSFRAAEVTLLPVIPGFRELIWMIFTPQFKTFKVSETTGNALYEVNVTRKGKSKTFRTNITNVFFEELDTLKLAINRTLQDSFERAKNELSHKPSTITLKDNQAKLLHILREFQANFQLPSMY